MESLRLPTGLPFLDVGGDNYASSFTLGLKL